ncbi:MAG: alkaline phosphatase, partial [Bacteroidales bacterium]|nr:alkaline phosphatase [Bacteroidales bacterium]
FSSLAEIDKLPNKDTKVIFTNPTLEKDASMPYNIDRSLSENSHLFEIVETAINFLDNPNGFFIMCEGGKIDFASHDNDAGALIGEMEDFDKAIAKAYEFYLAHKDETAIIVTADHETGGLSLGIGQNGYDSDLAVLAKQKMSKLRFSMTLKKLCKNDKEYSMKEYHDMASKYFLGIDTEFNARESEVLNEAFAATNAKSSRAKEESREKYNGYHPMAVAYSRVMNMRASVGFSTGSHTSAKVPVYAVGITTPIYDNTEFFNAIKSFIEK